MGVSDGSFTGYSEMWIALKKFLKLFIPPILPFLIFGIANFRKNASRRSTPDKEMYRPLFSPWLFLQKEIDDYKKIKSLTLISDERLYVLRWATRQALKLRTTVHCAGLKWVFIKLARLVL